MAFPVAEGHVVVETSAIAGRILALCLGMPSSGSCPARPEVRPISGNADRWIRTFRRKGRATKVTVNEDTFVESLGPTAVLFDLEVADHGCKLALRQCKVGPLTFSVPASIRLDVAVATTLAMDVDIHLHRQRGETSTTLLRYSGTMNPVA